MGLEETLERLDWEQIEELRGIVRTKRQDYLDNIRIVGRTPVTQAYYELLHKMHDFLYLELGANPGYLKAEAVSFELPPEFLRRKQLEYAKREKEKRAAIAEERKAKEMEVKRLENEKYREYVAFRRDQALDPSSV